MISIPDTDTLIPLVAGDNIFLFPSTSTDLVKLDLLFEAGSAYQTKKLCASATVNLMVRATQSKDAAEVADFLDYRGIHIETDSQVQQSTITVYFLRRYADEIIPLVAEMVKRPAFNSDDFDIWRKKRRHDILLAEQKTTTLARRSFYNILFGNSHPLGTFATAADADCLTVDDIRKFHSERYTADKMTVVLSGNVDDNVISLIRQYGLTPNGIIQRQPLASPTLPVKHSCGQHIVLPDATQSTIRIGRVVPLCWDSADYARMMLLTTALGGYFGSRLMSNLREDKGFTYGIYSRTQIYRGVIVFYITADIAAGQCDAAVKEVMGELRMLGDAAIPVDELELVRTVLSGDFLRSVDGIFERSARFCDMYGTCVTERLTDNLRDALVNASPFDLQPLAQTIFSPSEITVVTCGNE